jgi:hypothetical protein
MIDQTSYERFPPDDQLRAQPANQDYRITGRSASRFVIDPKTRRTCMWHRTLLSLVRKPFAGSVEIWNMYSIFK